MLQPTRTPVAAKALQALGEIDHDAAMRQAKLLSTQPAKGSLKFMLITFDDETAFTRRYIEFANLPFGNDQYFMLEPFVKFLNNVKNTDSLKKGIDLVVKIRGDIPDRYHYFTDPYINGALKDLLEKKRAQGLTEQADYIQSKLPEKKV